MGTGTSTSHPEAYITWVKLLASSHALFLFKEGTYSIMLKAVKYFAKKIKILSFVTTVSGRDRVTSRRRRNSVDRSAVDRSLDFSVYQCYYPKCIEPIPPTDPVVNPANTTAHRPAYRPANFIYVYVNTHTCLAFFFI